LKDTIFPEAERSGAFLSGSLKKRWGKIKACWMIWKFEISAYIYIVKQLPDEPYASPLLAHQLRKTNCFGWFYATGVWVSSVDKAGFHAIGPIGGVDD